MYTSNLEQKGIFVFFWTTLVFNILTSQTLNGQVLDAGFIDETIHTNTSTYVGLQIDHDNKIFVWEKTGKVWVIVNGLRSQNPVLDISDLVIENGDLGMLGFVLDPDFETNAFIYVSYVLRPILIPGNSGGNASNGATYGKVVRYTLDDPHSNSPIADINSALVLVGDNINGIPITSNAHFGGSLNFGTDGSLIVSSGDGASTGDDFGSDSTTYFAEAISLGIIDTLQNVGANRSQLNTSLSGKLLRINPLTGEGYPNNPYFDSSNPQAPISKVWSKGFRNPWSVLKVPGTGNTTEPGAFLVGDVGSGIYEELNYVNQSGMNFGWPYAEGIEFISPTYPFTPLNSWDFPKIQSRDIMYGNIHDMPDSVGSVNLPGDNVAGNAAIILGDFYNHSNFPFDYQNNFFYGDYASKHIYRVKFDNNFTPQVIKKFNFTGKFIFGVKTSIVDGSIYYLASDDPYGGNGELHKISYQPSNQPPVAKFKSSAQTGPQKLTIGFDASYSYDPEGGSINYSWSFTDGQTATGLAPFLTFTAPDTNYLAITATLTVTDSLGLSHASTQMIGLNNERPQIINVGSTPLIPPSITSGQPYSASFSATFTDESPSNVNIKWEVYEVHNGHEHLESTSFGNNVLLAFPNTSCDLGMATFAAKVKLTLTDTHGFETSESYIFSPNCGLTPQSISFPPVSTQYTNVSSLVLNATASSNLAITYYVLSGFTLVNGSSLNFFNIPGPIKVRATQHGNTVYDQAPPVDISFDYLKARMAQSISFSSASVQSIGASMYKLNASSSLGLPVKYVWVSGSAYVQNDTLFITSNASPVVVKAFNAGDFQQNYAESDLSISPCPNSLNLTDLHTVNDENSLKSKISISSTATIDQNIRVIYDTGRFINLLPGFKTSAGSVFETKLVGCQD
jgi:glucose/arabinose dehydrogenase